MANFNVNIFGTTHRGSGITPPKGYVLFNLHILQVESDISVGSFDMFLEFYTFPFNTIGNINQGTTIVAGGTNQPLLTNRKLVNQPQIVHLDQMQPTYTPLQLVNCSGLSTIVEPGFPTPPCIGGQDPFIATLTCPPPGDYRLYSNTFQFKTNLSSSSGTIDTNWSDVTDSAGGNNAFEKSFYLLPVKILIIADGCRYENNEAKVRIYSTYFVENLSSADLYGNVECWLNPNYKMLGYDDKILVD
jgi:hypothetical protein